MHFTDPLELFRAAVDVYVAGDYLGVARLADPVSLRAYKRWMLISYESRARTGARTADDILQRSPEMPRAVAEYQAAQFAMHSDPATQLALEMPGVSSLDDLRALAAAQVFVAALEGRSVQRHVERAVAEGRVAPEALLAMEQFNQRHQSFAAIGVVEDGPRIAYVVYRSPSLEAYGTTSQFEDNIAKLPADEQQLARDMIGREQPRYAICRRQPDGGWLLHVDHDFMYFGSMYLRFDPIEASDADEELGE